MVSMIDINQLTKDEYVKYCNDSANEYEEGVLNGNIVANQFIIQGVSRERELRIKYHYNQSKVDDVFKFAYYINISKGQRIKLVGWQCWVIKCLFGLTNAKGLRLRNEGVIWISRKNGKTAFTALLALYSLMKDNKGFKNEVYFLANAAKQAGIALGELKATIGCSPALIKRIDRLQYRLRYKTTNVCQPLAADPTKLDGLNCSFAVLDECHEQKTNDLYNIIKNGQIQRPEPLLIQISTSGFNKSYPFYATLEQCKKVLNNEIQDDETFIALYTLEKEEEIDNPEMWIKSNPSLGELIDTEKLIKDYKKSKRTQADFISFIVKNLNYYIDSEFTWLPDDLIVKSSKQLNINDFAGCKAYLGLDLSSTKDLTALSVCIEKDGVFHFFNEIYYPENEDNIVRLSGLDISDWITDSYIIQHQSPTIDYDAILNRINELGQLLDIQNIGYDKWNANYLISKLSGIYTVRNIPQTISFFNLPIKYYETQIFNNKVVIDKNPVVRWQFRNVILQADSNKCYKISKNKSKDSVDTPVAMMMALGLYIDSEIVGEIERQQITAEAKILKEW